ncbi:MAG: superoxide dismutase family protein [Ruminococcus sp.]
MYLDTKGRCIFINKNYFHQIRPVFREPLGAVAHIKGSEKYPEIEGTVKFYQTVKGVIVSAQISGLPSSQNPCESRVFGFHIHSGDSCTGDSTDSFKNAMSHYNPKDCRHPHHAGDLPPLFECFGEAFSAMLTNRFTLDEIIGKTVIIHSNPDDFTTQPSGNSGEKIACAVINKTCNCR